MRAHDVRRVLNCTPHPMHFYPAGTPDRIESGSVSPLFALEASPAPARANEVVVNQADDLGVPLVSVVVCPGALPEQRPGVLLLVSRPVAYLAEGREDLVVPYGDVRDLQGRTIGCRGLAWVRSRDAASGPDAGVSAVLNPLGVLVDAAKAAVQVEPYTFRRLGRDGRARAAVLVTRAQAALNMVRSALRDAASEDGGCRACAAGDIHQHSDPGGTATIPREWTSTPPGGAR